MFDVTLSENNYRDDDLFILYEAYTGDSPVGQIKVACFRGLCNFKCRYCFWHNLKFITLKGRRLTNEQIIAEIGDLPAFQVTGPEPTQHGDDLYTILKAVKEVTGKPTRIDTNGSCPDVLEKLLAERLLDHVVLDIKAPKYKYNMVTGVEVNVELIDRSLSLVKKYAPTYKIRTVAVKKLNNEDFLTFEDLLEITKWIGDDVMAYELKPYWSGGKENYGGLANFETYTHNELKDMASRLPVNARTTPNTTLSGY